MGSRLLATTSLEMQDSCGLLLFSFSEVPRILKQAISHIAVCLLRCTLHNAGLENIASSCYLMT